MQFNRAPSCGVRTIVLAALALAVSSKTNNDDSKAVMRMASLAPDGKVDVAEKPSFVDDVLVDGPKEKTTNAPTKVDPDAEAGKEMLDAAKKESESSGSAKINAKLMAGAATKQAESIEEATKGKIAAILSGAKSDMSIGFEKGTASMNEAKTSSEDALVDTKEELQDVVQALKAAKTNDEAIVANAKAETTCHKALDLANKTMNSFQTMSDRMHGEATYIKTVADNAAEVMEKELANATKEINAIANQLSEVGLAVSTKLQAKADANEIASLVTETAKKIKATADKLAADGRDTITIVRSSGAEVSGQIISSAATAKADGDDITSNFANTIYSAMQDIATAKAAWLSADVDAMGKLSKRLSSMDEGSVPSAKPQPADQTLINHNDWFTKFVYLSVILAIVAVTGGLFVRACQTKAQP